jgi:hypothetical protein
MTMKGRDETEEGIDKKLAVHYYARWKFISDLLPALKNAKESGEDAKVISVLAAGKGGEIDLEDLGLKKTFSLTKAGLQAPTYNDLMVEVSPQHFLQAKQILIASTVIIGICCPKSRSSFRPRIPRSCPHVPLVFF